MFSKKDIWVETGYDKDKHVLWNTEFTENITEGRLMNALITNDYKILYADVNTVLLQRIDETRICRWNVLSRKTPILWPFLKNTDV